MSVKRILWMFSSLLLGYWLSPLADAACPVRVSTYIGGTVSEPDQVMSNEDALFEGIQDGLETDCIANNAITTAKIATGGVTSSDILDGTVTTTDLAFAINPGNTLPAGAVFFMVTGSCPAWTTDVSATYSNLFLRINATQGTLGGSDTHTHAVGSFVGSAHTHSISDPTTARAWSAAAGSTTTSDATGAASVTDAASWTAESGGGGAVTGTSASATLIPSFVTMKACQVS